jgi:radical SAM superfamily enzyme YgiQ (UPF0313 family)
MIVMKSLLVFPPHWSVSHPYLSLPCLSAYLNKFNIESDLIDLNAKCMNTILSKEFIQKCLDKIKEEEEENIKLLGNKYSVLLEMGQSAVKYINSAVEIMKIDKNFFNIEEYVFAEKIIRYACQIVSQAHKIEFNVSSFKYREGMNFNVINEFLSDKDSNIYIELYKAILSKEYLEKYNHIAISLIGFEQLLPTFTLCNYIRSINPDIKITIGGSVLSKLADGFSNKEYEILFKFFDYILTFEGEEHLKNLILAINNNYDINDVNNLIYYDFNNRKVIFNELSKLKLDINSLPTPDFSKYDMRDYFFPRTVLPYYLSRSCYWGKCSFCDHDYGYDGRFRCKTVEKIIEDIRVYKENYNAEILHFIDEAIHPKLMEKLCTALINNNIDIKWFCYIRASKEFTSELCEKMKLAGCIHIMVGVESCSDEVLKAMDKGIDKDTIKYTLENLNRNGIWSHLFLINNFPTETAENRLETLLFILNNIEICHSMGMGDFSLMKKSKITKQPIKYGIKNISDISSLSIGLMFESELKNEEMHFITKEFNKIFDKFSNKNYFFTHVSLFREHLPVYLSEYNFIDDDEILDTMFKKLGIKG